MQNLRDETLLEELLYKYDCLVNQHFLHSFHDFTLCESHSSIDDIILLEVEILEEPIAPDFFVFVLNTLGDLNIVYGYILLFSNDLLTFYIGLKANEDMDTALEVLKNGLRNSYPKSKFKELSSKESSLVLDQLLSSEDVQALSSAIVIPSNTSQAHSPINQKLVDLMKHEDFVAIFLASSTSFGEVKHLIKELQDLYTALFPFSQAQYSLSHSFAKNPSTQLMKSITETDGKSSTVTDGVTHEIDTTKELTFTPTITTQSSDLPLLSIGIACSESTEITNTNNYSIAKAEGQECAVTKSTLSITSNTTTNENTMTFVSQNKFVTDLLQKLDILIERLISISGEVLFYFGAYFLSSSVASNMRAAHTYAGLARNKNINLGRPVIATWRSQDCIFPQLINEIKNFNPLSFIFHNKNCITTSTLITSTELLNSFYFPYPKSIPSPVYTPPST